MHVACVGATGAPMRALVAIAETAWVSRLCGLRRTTAVRKSSLANPGIPEHPPSVLGTLGGSYPAGRIHAALAASSEGAPAAPTIVG